MLNYIITIVMRHQAIELLMNWSNSTREEAYMWVESADNSCEMIHNI